MRVTGWTVCGGVEYAPTRNWPLKGEYLYVALPNRSVNEFNPGFPTYRPQTN